VDLETSHALYTSPSNPSVDEIDFNITATSDTGGGFNAGTGVATITPQSALPSITNAVLINGYTQQGDLAISGGELSGTGNLTLTDLTLLGSTLNMSADLTVQDMTFDSSSSLSGDSVTFDGSNTVAGSYQANS